ncbi:MAG: DUF2807 domain-containing protein [Paludibacter sp.]|nr:DUF2807 domain-containing protein [Paludibacter sp.]
MKKTLTINLNGRVFNIDEDAYVLLDNYLENLKTYFSKLDGGNEIMNDFEARISEIFSGKLAQGYNVINIDDVEQTIAQMGRPSDFDENQEKESAFEQFAANQNSSNNAENANAKQKKQFFRDPQNKILGGVCSGVAAFFGWEATWVRLAVALMFFCSIPFFSWILTPGWLIILYVILWVIVPEAKTAEQRLKMTGEDVTVENIGKTVAAQTNNAVNQAQNNGCASAFLKICLILFGIFIGFPILFALVIVVIVLIATLLGVSTGILGSLIPWTNETFMFVQHPAIATIGFCLLIGIPCVALLYWICQKIFHWGKIHKSIKIITLVVWLASVVMLSVAGWNVDWRQLKNQNGNIGWGNFQINKHNIDGDGNIVERTYNFSQNINKINVQSKLNIDLQIDSIKSNVAEFAIQTDSNIIDFVEINVKGNTLMLNPKRHYNLIPSAPIIIKMKTNELSNIELNGASTLSISNAFNINNLDIEVSGASNLKIANIEADKIECEISGASEASFTGTAKILKAEASGASSIFADKLTAENVEAEASGASTINCFAVNSLSAEATGASSVNYYGTPKTISKDASGAGRINQK